MKKVKKMAVGGPSMSLMHSQPMGPMGAAGRRAAMAASQAERSAGLRAQRDQRAAARTASRAASMDRRAAIRGGAGMKSGGAVGGSYRKAADGIASKGKTKGKAVVMRMGGKC